MATVERPLEVTANMALLVEFQIEERTPIKKYKKISSCNNHHHLIPKSQPKLELMISKLVLLWTNQFSIPFVFPRNTIPDTAFYSRMLELALGDDTFNGIFSLSIEPCNPKLGLTLFYRRSFALVEGVTGIQKKTYECYSNDQAPPATRRLTGFLKPYPTFESGEFIPEVDPQSPPKNVTCYRPQTSQDVANITSDLEPKELRQRVSDIAEAFLCDPLSKKIYLITVQPFHTPSEPVKRKLLIKA